MSEYKLPAEGIAYPTTCPTCPTFSTLSIIIIVCLIIISSGLLIYFTILQ